jgi:hypothetical protein
MKQAMFFGVLTPLILSTVAAATAARVSSQSLRRSPRILQETMCNDTVLTDFPTQALGPASANNSLYNNVPLEVLITTYGGFNLTVDIGSLADSLLNIELHTGAVVQQDQYFGHNREYTRELMNQHLLIAEFWKVEGPTVLLAGLHSDPLQDQDNVVNAVARWAVVILLTNNITTFNITAEDIMVAADSVQKAIETEVPNTYANSALSNNAYFTPLTREDGVFEGNTVIVIGDGILDLLASKRLGEVGNDYIHAHEFGHKVQFIIDLEDVGGDYDVYTQNFALNQSPETSRQSELEADALAAYFLAHAQGRNFEVELLVEVTKSALDVGDCFFDSDTHHGTPEQRECATRWAADEGLDMTGDPVTMREFRTLFRQNLDGILALDPSVCTLTDDAPASRPSTGGGGSGTTIILVSAFAGVAALAIILWCKKRHNRLSQKS